jgi:hypothetical protein
VVLGAMVLKGGGRKKSGVYQFEVYDTVHHTSVSVDLHFGVGLVCEGASSARVGPVTWTPLDGGGKRPV